jgi:hypothetical protein
MNKQTRGLVWLGVVLVIGVALVAGGGRALWTALLAMHGVH